MDSTAVTLRTKSPPQKRGKLDQCVSNECLINAPRINNSQQGGHTALLAPLDDRDPYTNSPRAQITKIKTHLVLPNKKYIQPFPEQTPWANYKAIQKQLSETQIIRTDHLNSHRPEGVNPIHNKVYRTIQHATFCSSLPLLLRIHNTKIRNSNIYARATSQGKSRIYGSINTNGNQSQVKEKIRLTASILTTHTFPNSQ